MLSKLMSAVASCSLRELETETLPLSLSLTSLSSCEPFLMPTLTFDFVGGRADVLRLIEGEALRFLLALEFGLEYGC